MTRARTSAQKRRDKRIARAATITLPGGELAPQRAKQGQRERKEPADMVALQARARGRQQPALVQARHSQAKAGGA